MKGWFARMVSIGLSATALLVATNCQSAPGMPLVPPEVSRVAQQETEKAYSRICLEAVGTTFRQGLDGTRYKLSQGELVFNASSTLARENYGQATAQEKRGRVSRSIAVVLVGFAALLQVSAVVDQSNPGYTLEAVFGSTIVYCVGGGFALASDAAFRRAAQSLNAGVDAYNKDLRRRLESNQVTTD